MKNKWSLRRKNIQSDIFENTQSRLTFFYSGLMMLFLALFVMIVYFLVYVVVMEDQKSELGELTHRESRIILDYLAENTLKELQGLESQQIVLAGVDQFFYYVVDREGNLVMGQEMLPQMRMDLLQLLQGWIPRKNEVREETLQITVPKKEEIGHGPRRIGDDAKVKLMIDGRPLFYNDQFIGMLYIGKDITFVHQLFKWLLIVLVILAILFFGVALFMSRYMSKKAMIPISQAFARQREFVGDASHELRTPLSIMLSSINAIEMTDSMEEDPFVRKLLLNMKTEVKRMTKLVSDLLVLARSDSGIIEHQLKPFDFRPAAEKVVESVYPLAQEKKISLDFDTPSAVPVSGDPERLTQLLYILLDNAIKYTPDEGKVNLSLTMDKRELSITVQDTGIGIEPEDCTRIFDRFYRSDKSRSRAMGGHGLGLSIAKWIVTIHGGTIGVDSKLRKGSTFIVRLPIIQEG
ncbi:sensor histidine kinase [Pseudobacillus wudalianchiensis]|uniref:histidine kinase n=1 Tax=Pseudobacillus wudalianchiensis TaxID=1743143 RepID=A0A1B9B895_9BACI|nr:ATP-binding protein [Bacillus wudalianchiensis]OCA92309.1 two-component sensor histidine kinase [Bacillus wudalianchiensis]